MHDSQDVVNAEVYDRIQSERKSLHYQLVCRLFELDLPHTARQVALCPIPGKVWAHGAKPCKHRACPYCLHRRANQTAKQLTKQVLMAVQPVFITITTTHDWQSITTLNKDLQKCKPLAALNRIVVREYDLKTTQPHVRRWRPHVHIIADAAAWELEALYIAIDDCLPWLDYNVHLQPLARTYKDVYRSICYCFKVPEACYTNGDRLREYMELTKSKHMVTTCGKWQRGKRNKRLTPYHLRRKYGQPLTEHGTYRRILRISTITGEMREMRLKRQKRRE